MDYITLRKQVIDAGFLERQYGYYAFKVISSLAMVMGFGFFLFTAQNLWLQLLLVVGLIFAFMQFAFLAHDAGHKAIFNGDFWNDAFGQLFLTFFCGVGYNYWVDRHKSHHANPNQEGEDPDLEVFALTEKALSKRRGISLFLAERQHWLFFPTTGTFILGMQPRSIIFNLRLKHSVSKLYEFLLLLAHFGLVWIMPFFLLPVWKAVGFVLLLRLLMGVYFGSVSATNHKGMKVINEGEKLDFVEKQVITARNVRNGFLVDFVYGGLNYQIEHHLFPTMPRNNFKKCKPVVKRFCKENSLPYEETGVIQSYREILAALRAVALSRKRNKAAKPVASPFAPITAKEKAS